MEKLSAISKFGLRALANFSNHMARSPSLVVLTYHRVLPVPDPIFPDEPDVVLFAQQIDLLTSLFNILPLHEAVKLQQESKLPSRSICITFDDGYANNYTVAAPILYRKKIPATVFVSTGFIGNGRMWNDTIIELVRAANDKLDLTRYGLGTHDISNFSLKRSTIDYLLSKIKYHDPKYRLDLVNRIANDFGYELPNNFMLTEQQIISLHKQGIEIGAHTVTHPILATLDEDRARHEIMQSKLCLEEIIGDKVNSFAYPNGRPGYDYQHRHVRLVQSCGYSCAVTTSRGSFDKKGDPFQIPRIAPWDKSSLKYAARVIRTYMQPARHILKDTSNISVENRPIPIKSSTKKLLFIAYHFPPVQASTGVIRILSFAKYLKQLGWESVIMTVNKNAYEHIRCENYELIPDGLHAVRSKAFDAKRHFSLFGQYPSLFSIPDRWQTWIPFGVIDTVRRVRSWKPRLIMSTYPISSAHWIAYFVHKITGINWVADIRDPLYREDLSEGSIINRSLLILERKIFKNASRVIVTTNALANIYKDRYPLYNSDNIIKLSNGFDPELLDAAALSSKCLKKSHKMQILHSGILYPHGRNPYSILIALSELFNDGLIDKSRVEFCFRAAGNEAVYIDMVAKLGLSETVHFLPVIPYRDALSEIYNADGVLLIQGGVFNKQIPAKLYEYLYYGRPILALVDSGGETHDFLRELGVLDVCQPDDVSQIKKALLNFLHSIEGSVAYVVPKNKILNYSRKALTAKLAMILDSIVV